MVTHWMLKVTGATPAKDIKSAAVSGRDGFGKILSYLRRHKDVRKILVKKADRLSRNFGRERLDGFVPSMTASKNDWMPSIPTSWMVRLMPTITGRNRHSGGSK